MLGNINSIGGNRVAIQRIYLSASQMVAVDDCRYLHYLQKIKRIRVAVEPANLAFGSCIDGAVRDYLYALASLKTPPNPIKRFQELWRRARARAPLTYAPTRTPRMMERMGLEMMRALPESWQELGYQVACDDKGTPLLAVELAASLGQRWVGGKMIEVVLVGKIDLFAYTTRSFALLDLKSAAAVPSVNFCLRADQLTIYQILLEANRLELGLPSVGELGFWDFLKRKEAKIEKPVLVPPRSHRELLAFREKAFWHAEHIVRRQFPKASRLQHNTPCDQCNFARLCIHGDEEGYLFPEEATKHELLRLAA